MTTILNNIPQGYKATALGVIPQEWKAMRLGDVCTLINGRAYKQNELLSQGKYKILRVGNFFTNESWYFSDMELDSSKYAFKGDLLYAWSASFGPRFWTGDQVIYHYHIWKICNYRGVDQQYLYYFLDYDASLLQRDTQGGTMHHITKQSMEKRFIPVPPLGEQRKIAEVLGVWDLAIAKQVQLVERLTQRKRALMQRLLTAKLRLPGFSTPWKKVHYSDILKEVRRTLTWDEHELYDLISVRRRSGGVFHRESLYGHEIKTKTLRPALEGDFLISKMQIVHGASGVVPKHLSGMKISGSYIALIAKDPKKLNINYFNLWSQMPLFYHQTFVSSYGVHIEKMTFDLDAFMSLSMNLPPIEEQNRIVEVISTATDEIELAQAKLELYRRQKRGLMQQLLTGKKRVTY